MCVNILYSEDSIFNNKFLTELMYMYIITHNDKSFFIGNNE